VSVTTRLPRPRFAASAVIALVTLTLLAGVVAAHAELVSSNPKAGSSVATPPTEIVLTFSEALDPKKSSMTVAMVGDPVRFRGGTVSASAPKVMRLAVPDLGTGEFDVHWTSASAEDGDLDRGDFAFNVAGVPAVATDNGGSQAATSPPLSPSASPSATPDPAAASGTDALLPVVAAIVVIGVLGYVLLRNRRAAARR
jgi:copper resistance protein C